MSSTAEIPILQKSLPASAWWSWLPVAIGLAAICLPSFLGLAQTTWDTEENGHGPIILMVVVWLFWQKRHVLVETAPQPSPVLGWISLVLGLMVFIVGRSQAINTLEVGALLPILIGVLLLGFDAVLRATLFRQRGAAA